MIHTVVWRLGFSVTVNFFLLASVLLTWGGTTKSGGLDLMAGWEPHERTARPASKTGILGCDCGCDFAPSARAGFPR